MLLGRATGRSPSACTSVCPIERRLPPVTGSASGESGTSAHRGRGPVLARVAARRALPPYRSDAPASQPGRLAAADRPADVRAVLSAEHADPDLVRERDDV